MQEIIVATSNYHAQTAKEISFLRGDEFKLITAEDNWLLVSLVDNSSRQGFIPTALTNYGRHEDFDALRIETMSISSMHSNYNDESASSEDDELFGEEAEIGPSLIRRRLSKLTPMKRAVVSKLPVDAISILKHAYQGVKPSLLCQFWNEGSHD